jgi:hypothetical protein
MSTEPSINGLLRDYATSAAAADWGHHAHAEALYAWAECLAASFGLGVPTPVILIDRVRSRSPRYRPGRNGLGLLHEVRLPCALLELPLALRLAGLFRELLRLREALAGRPCSGRYASAALRRTARDCGLAFDRHGELRGVEAGAFTALLQAHGVDVGPLLGGESLAAPSAGSGRLKRWDCGCTRVRCATALRARCTACGREFAAAAEAKERMSRLNRTTAADQGVDAPPRSGGPAGEAVAAVGRDSAAWEGTPS